MSARLQTDSAHAIGNSAKAMAPQYNLVRKAALRQIRVGLVLLVIGLVVTVVTYSHASSSPTGGTYIVAWGPILFGAIGAVRGFILLARSRKVRG